MFYHWFLDEPDPAAREVQMAKLRSSERSDRSHPFSHNLLHIRHLIKQSDQNHENTASMIKSSSNTNKWIFVQLASWQTQYHLWLASTSVKVAAEQLDLWPEHREGASDVHLQNVWTTRNTIFWRHILIQIYHPNFVASFTSKSVMKKSVSNLLGRLLRSR